jgi:hypothetical protein
MIVSSRLTVNKRAFWLLERPRIALPVGVSTTIGSARPPVEIP